jgi:hypothetical protein
MSFFTFLICGGGNRLPDPPLGKDFLEKPLPLTEERWDLSRAGRAGQPIASISSSSLEQIVDLEVLPKTSLVPSA